MLLNEEERKRLSAGKCICINQFLNTTLSVPEVRKVWGEIVVEIKVGPSYEICNGYYTSGQQALFNIGNFYEILGYDEARSHLTVSLLAFPKDMEIKQDHHFSGILFYQLRLEKMDVLK